MSEGKSAHIYDADVPWLNEIPAHWTIHRLRRVVAKFVDYRGRTPEKSDDGIPLITTGAIRNGRIDHSRNPEWVSEKVYEELLTRGMPEVGDLLFTSEAPLGEVAILEDSNFALAQRIILFKVEQSRITSNFLKYHFISNSGKGEIQSRASGSTAEGIRADRLKMSLVPTPPVKEQTPIAQFLDRKTAAIDALIAKKQRLIELLEEKRSALINQAVTKGLNPDAPMKDSGIPWIGEIPEHWNLIPLKWIAGTDSGSTPNSGSYAEYYEDGDIKWVRTLDLNNSEVWDTEVKITSKALKDTACKIMPPGTVMVAMYGGSGTIGKHGILRVPSTTNQAVCGITINQKIYPDFLHHYVQFYRPHWMIDAVGTRRDPNISQEIVRNLRIACPPFEEQLEITKFLKVSSEATQKLISVIEKSISKLQEYRQSVITAAVTGKLDVA